MLQLARSPIGIALAYFHHSLLDLLVSSTRTVMRSPAPLRDPLDSVLQITLDPKPTGRNRHSKFLAQGPEGLLFPYRSYHELHSLLSNIHGSEWHPLVRSRARLRSRGSVKDVPEQSGKDVMKLNNDVALGGAGAGDAGPPRTWCWFLGCRDRSRNILCFL